MTIRAAVIGASFARAAYLPALKTVPDVEIVAVASAHLGSAKAAADAFGVPHAYDDWRAMLAEHHPDLVGIATPVVYHAPMTLAALEAGAHVICEKPMAMNADEARRMLEHAEALGRVHMIGHELRFNPNRRKIKRLIEEGAIGSVRQAIVVNVTPSWGDPASRPQDDWWSLESMGGGRLGANGSHQIDLLRFWLGDIGLISGQVATLVPERIGKDTGQPWTATADDETSFTMEMKSGALVSAIINSAARHNMGNQVQIFGSEGTILLADAGETLQFARAGEPFENIAEPDPNSDLPGIGPGIWNAAFVGLIHEATAAIREGRPPREGATFADGLKAQEAMDAVRRSWAERRWIMLD